MTRRDGAVHVEGDERLRRTLRRAADELGDLRETHQAAAQVIVDASAPPVRSGALAGGLRATATATEAVTTVVGEAARYAGVIHWGAPSRHIAAQPWFVEAERASHSEVIDVYADRVDDITRKIEGM